jgi:hypothetical protein
MEETVEAFWANFEKETGEKVLAKTMGQYFSSSKDRGDWGLLVLSPTGLRFRKTPGENWFASLFKASAPLVSTRGEEDLFIPYVSIKQVVNPPRKFLDFLFGSPFLAIVISYRVDESEREARLALDPKSDFQAKLKELTQSA